MRLDLERRATSGERTRALRPFLGLLAALCASSGCAPDRDADDTPPANATGPEPGAETAGAHALGQSGSPGARRAASALQLLAQLRGEAVSAARSHSAGLLVEASRPGGGARLRDTTSGAGVTVRVHGARPSQTETIDGAIVHPGAGPGASDLVIVPTPDGVEDWVVFGSRPARDAVGYTLALENVAGLRLVAGVLELLDATGAPRLRARPPYLVDAKGTAHAARFELLDCEADTAPSAPWGRAVRPPGREACRVDVTWDGARVAYPAALDPVWELTTGSLAKGRRWHTATPLGANSASPVLVVGGFDGTTAVGLAELYQPLSRTFAATGALGTARGAHAAVRLADGTVLVAGGASAVSSAATGDDTSGELGSLERYDPGTGAFSAAPGTLAPVRANLTATLLGDGKVLLVGGQDTLGQPLKTTAVFDPAGPSLATGPTMTFARAGHTATAVDATRVIIAGGFAAVDANSLKNSEIYDQTGGSFAAGPSMIFSRAYHTATTLDDGRILFAGGISKPNDPANAKIHETTELYTPAAGIGAIAQGPSMSKERAYHAAAKLATGGVVLSGGFGGDPVAGTPHAPHGNSEVFDPATNKVDPGPDMSTARLFHTLVAVNPAGSIVDGAALPAEGMLAAGGVPVQGVNAPALASAELLLRPLGEACALAVECASGHCSDSVCCDAACDGECDSCAQALKESGSASGTCEPSKEGVADGSTLTDGPDLGSQCIANVVSFYTCDGAGNKVLYYSEDCKGNPCDGDGTKCTETCDGVTAKCLISAWCNLAVGKCEPKRDIGEACESNEQCENLNGNEDDGFCVDGVCCNNTCLETCNACNVTGFVGTCTHSGTNFAQPPVGARACANPTPAGDEACAGFCDVKVNPSPLDCTYPGATLLCGAKKTCACEDGGECVTGPTTQARFACDGVGACAASDVGDDGTTAYVTDCAGHLCAPPAEDGQQQCATECASDADCLIDYFCAGSTCELLPETGLCDGQFTLRVKAGDDIDCRPYLCPAGETACRPKCASDSECVPAGEVADPDNALVCDNDGACVPPPDAPTLPSCGVARDVPGGGSFASAALGLLLGALVRRRRARRT